MHLRHLFAEWKNITNAVQKAGKIVLGFDFDGTLSPIVSNPEEAAISEELKIKLKDIASHEKAEIAVISGRECTDLEQRVGLKGIYYSGDHGLTIKLPNGKLEKPVDHIRNFKKDVEIREISANVEKIEGVKVDIKEHSLTVHYRNAPKGTDRLLKPILLGCLPTASLVMNRGRMCWEIRQKIDWNKGKSFAWISDRVTTEVIRKIQFYLGDDTTDEDVFDLLTAETDYPVLIPSSEKMGKTSARYYLGSQSEVTEFADRLLESLV